MHTRNDIFTIYVMGRDYTVQSSAKNEGHGTPK